MSRWTQDESNKTLLCRDGEVWATFIGPDSTEEEDAAMCARAVLCLNACQDCNPEGFSELLLAAKALTDIAHKTGLFRDTTERAMKAIAKVEGE